MNRAGVSVVLVTVMSTALAGCQGVLWGNVVVLGVTVGLFFGTLQLGRQGARAEDASSNENASTRSAAQPR